VGDDEVTYPLAPNGIFWSLQGEGHLRGFQMAFLRFAGCSVGCPQCDTDYSVAEKLEPWEIVRRIDDVLPDCERDQWVWITGGEPTDHDLRPLLKALSGAGYRVALATSGVRPHIPPVDWLSVSPHSVEPGRFRQRYGSELKLVDGLHGLSLDEWAAAWGDRCDFMYRYVQPASRKVFDKARTVAAGLSLEDPESLARCLAFLKKNPTWALSRQDHHVWAVS
jgi:7-carboxy-7-deazaguanine synthase